MSPALEMAAPGRSGLLGSPVAPEERQKALEDPGPSWTEWLYFSFLKVWILLGLFTVDGWIVASWLGVRGAVLVPGLVASLVAAVYLELLLYRYLWYRAPAHEREFHRTWLRPTRFGRWTPEAWDLRRTGRLSPAPGELNPDEFL